MGCGTSKSDAIKSASSADAPFNKNKESTNSSAKSDASTIPANDAYQNGGSGNNNATGTKAPKTLPPLKPLRGVRSEKPPEPIAFEVPATEGGDGSLIKKHPPKRLRQLEEKSPELPNLTQKEIEDKVALANQRRNQVLTQRVASARQKSARGGRTRKPVTESEQYSMAEYESEIFGHGHGADMDHGDFS